MKVDLNLDHVVSRAQPMLVDWLETYFSPVRILVVVDGDIDLRPGAGTFGVERTIRLLRESIVGCFVFNVDVASRERGPLPIPSSDGLIVVDSPTGTNPNYFRFRFDSTLPGESSLLINHYDEILCFGWRPQGFEASDISVIEEPSSLPLSTGELAALAAWMSKGGGLFATGDHFSLGASMCYRIPRVGTMRAWTNDQGVPSLTESTRIDTNRPSTPGQADGSEVIPEDAEEDVTPQQISWVVWRLDFEFPGFPDIGLPKPIFLPHPVLSHPELGAIDVMPDHPHEGVVFDHEPQPDVGSGSINLTGRYNFGSVAGDEYPTVDGVQPLPQVIASETPLATLRFNILRARLLRSVSR